jgi:hypothetical protein
LSFFFLVAFQEIVDNRGGVFPLPSEHLLNILDEASEKTFLCGEPPLATQNYGYQADAGKNQYEEKNLIASLSFIVEQTLVSSSTLNMMYDCLSCGGHFLSVSILSVVLLNLGS